MRQTDTYEGKLPEARKEIADILERRDCDRPMDLWKSDIMRMTDMMLWIFNVWAKPMTYRNGNTLIFDEFCHSNVADSDAVESIEKTDSGYIVKADGTTLDLNKITDVSILRPLLGLLLFKEWLNWDYYCDMA